MASTFLIWNNEIPQTMEKKVGGMILEDENMNHCESYSTNKAPKEDVNLKPRKISEHKLDLVFSDIWGVYFLNTLMSCTHIFLHRWFYNTCHSVLHETEKKKRRKH